MKWNANDITQFLNIYEAYPILWNVKHTDYCNTKLKEEILTELYNELAEKGLVEGMDVKQLKAKIKSIKDVYRQELNKIEKSKKSGSGAEDLYTPKLAWFNTANYLSEMLSTKKITSNLDLSQNSDAVTFRQPDEDSDRKFAETSMKKKSKKHPSEQEPSIILDAIQQLGKIAQHAAEDKPYDQFGKFVAAELRQLPQRQAILLQQDIQNCIIGSKLAALDHLPSSLSPSINPSLHSQAASTSGDNDILHQVVTHTLGDLE